MADNKKDFGLAEKKEKHVEKLTDEALDKVSGGTKVGCQPSWPPCEPRHKAGGLTATPCEPKAGAPHKRDCAPTGKRMNPG